jgi:branched-chain amino acid aminotransferase
MQETYYLNGSFVTRDQARISAMDYGFLYGYGLFDTMRAYRGVIFRLDDHLQRVAVSAEFLKIPINIPEIKKALIDILRVNELKEARVRLSISIGEGSLVPDPRHCGRPTVFIAAAAYVPIKPEIYIRGYRLKVSSTRRWSQSSLLRMKTANYLENLLLRQEAQAAGVDDALILNEKSFVAETTVSNIFLSINHILKTPRFENGLLKGITRNVVLELAVQQGMEIQETDILLEELLNAEEVFLTNSILELMPVTMIDDTIIGVGKPGLLTVNLMHSYANLVNRETGEKNC